MRTESVRWSPFAIRVSHRLGESTSGRFGPARVAEIIQKADTAATMSVTGALVGEFVASERGLGSLIITGGVTMQTPSIFASLILISTLGLVLYGLVVAAERIVAPWAQRDETTG